MTNDAFTAPETTADEWIDVRMTDPEHGEWDVDVVVAGGRVEYVDLRIKPALCGRFVDCLLDDVDKDRAASILHAAASRRGVDLDVDRAGE
ncbi:hypothetical protein ACFO5R_20770 [Halosolutus amylolyticus]|uniref:Uncharacterized protein n=1 Tax=Halosolutus amylolyticus TaxID=2932267 RepID=A0ABD5PWN3_9EURY|nr:hypothetical protein [Halosolutus amylolyticus]